MTFTPPDDYPRIKTVQSFEELIKTPFGPDVNALCWERAFTDDFDEVAACFRDEREIASLDEELMKDLRQKLSPPGQQAVDVLLKDLYLLQEHGLLPSLECVPYYREDDISAVIATDVYSFHADRAPIAADTYLCSYNQVATEGLRNDAAARHIDIPATRAELHNQFKREGAVDFDAWLREHCYDLHYAPKTGAVPFSFGIGNLWRIAIEYPGCPVPPCLHRAPQTASGDLPRLLLIS